jgi:hypothetical protein
MCSIICIGRFHWYLYLNSLAHRTNIVLFGENLARHSQILNSVFGSLQTNAEIINTFIGENVFLQNHSSLFSRVSETTIDSI